MTDKIRIVGSFAEDVADKVKAFVRDLEGVQHVEVLRDGVNTYDAGDDEPGAPESAQETAPAPEPPAPAEEPAPAPEAPTQA